MSAASAASRLPSDPRRLIIYALYSRRGDIDDYVMLALDGLRDHAERILVVVNGDLGAAGREQLDGVGVDVIERRNEGFDIHAHRAGLEAVGDGIGVYDEVVLTNDTWFGPVRPFAPVFAKMDSEVVDFWGMTDHARTVPHPLTGHGVAPYHLQTYWIAARKNLLLSPEWASYWRDLPPLPTYVDAVVKHESTFTEHFVACGFRAGVAFGADAYPSENPSLLNADLLIRDGCPVLKRRPLFQWPPYLDRRAVIGRWTLAAASAEGYPLEPVWQSLARTVEPKVLNTDAAMLEVIPDARAVYDPARPLRIAVVMHVHYPEMTGLLLDHADTLPGSYDLVVTTSDEPRAAAIRTVTALRERRGRVDVRVVESNDGRDLSAFLIGARDVILSDAYDLVVKLHSKRTPQDGFVIGRHFLHQQLSNLLGGARQTEGMLALFQREAGLGLVFPPSIHIGYPTMGHGWWANKTGFLRLASELGIRVPPDESSPLAPYGSMFAARPAALRLLAEHHWRYADFGGPDAYRDGGPAHVLERMPVYAAGELGFHTRTIAAADYLSISHAALDYNYDRLAARVPGPIDERIDLVLRAGDMGSLRLTDVLRIHLRLRYPGLGARLRRRLGLLVALKRAVRRLRT